MYWSKMKFSVETSKFSRYSWLVQVPFEISCNSFFKWLRLKVKKLILNLSLWIEKTENVIRQNNKRIQKLKKFMKKKMILHLYNSFLVLHEISFSFLILICVQVQYEFDYLDFCANQLLFICNHINRMRSHAILKRYCMGAIPPFFS